MNSRTILFTILLSIFANICFSTFEKQFLKSYNESNICISYQSSGRIPTLPYFAQDSAQAWCFHLTEFLQLEGYIDCSASKFYLALPENEHFMFYFSNGTLSILFSCAFVIFVSMIFV